MNGLISGKSTINRPQISLETKNNAKELSDQDMQIHIRTMNSMLDILARTIYEKLPDIGQNNIGLEDYILRTSQSLDLIVKKHAIELLKSTGTNKLNCVIDPTDSGFPVALRDFKYLEIDKREAESMLKNLPADSSLIDSAEYFLFRDSFPTNVIKQKLERNYYTSLMKLDLLSELKTYSAREIKKESNGHLLYKKSFEKLDDYNNMPKFYTLYFTVTGNFAKYFALTEDTKNPIGWQADLEKAIEEGTGSMAALELPYLARKIEDIEGVQLQMIERFDIGPFYNKFTENQEAITKLLEESRDTDGILSFKRNFIQREGERSRTKFLDKMKAAISGDTHRGIFQQVLQSPTYMLMPHRLIQKVHNMNLNLEGETILYGINNAGGLIG